jgi:AcrR family transcriptional regulator
MYHDGMGVLSQDTGRVEQKRRTRESLMEAAAGLLREGRTPTVAATADRAGVSRATAYRYFPTQDTLLAPAQVHAGESPVSDERLLDTGAVTAPVARAAIVARRVAEYGFDNEQLLRTALRHSLDPDLDYKRPGHRRRWIADLLAPLQESTDERILRRLASALHLVLGIEALVALIDTAGLDRDEALDVLAWTAETLVDAAARSSATKPKSPRLRDRAQGDSNLG